MGVANMVLPICFLIMHFAATLAYWFVFKPEVTILTILTILGNRAEHCPVR